MIKRGFAYFLAGVILTAALSGCGTSGGKVTDGGKTDGTTASGTQVSNTSATSEPADPFGKYDETVVINVARSVDPTEKLPDGDTPEDNQYTRYVKDMLNIDAKTMWTAAQGKDYDQKVNLAIASNDLPDAMVVGITQFRMAAKADQIQDLTEVYNKYASPEIKQMVDSSKGIAMKAVTLKGKMMAIPSLNVPDDSYHLAWIRKDWLDKLGLQVPKTMDDLEMVAKAFVERDPDGNGKADTIGITGPQNGGELHASFLAPNNNSFGFDPIFSAYRSYPGFWVKGPDGKAAYGSILPETRTALAKLRDLYAKGLIDRQIGVRKDATEPIVGGKSGIYFGMWWSGYWPLPDAIKNDPNANWQAYAVPLDAEGVFNPHMGTPANLFCIVKKGFEHPEAAMKIINLNNRDEAKYDLAKGGVGNEVLRLPMSSYIELGVTIQALKDVLNGSKKPEDYAAAEYVLYSKLQNDAGTIKKVKLEPYDKLDIQYWNPQGDSNFNRMYSLMVGCAPIYDPNVKMNRVESLVYSQTKTMESKWVNLKKLEDEAFLKIIMGAAPVESFDKFVSDWKAQGGDQITAEVEAELNQ